MLYRLQKVVRHIAQTEVMPRFLNTPSRRKEDGSVLSEADLAAQTAFAAALPLLEDCPMLGEEMSVLEQTRLWNEHSDGLWIVDPIDGTNNFVNGLPHFAVSMPNAAKAHSSTARRCRCVPKTKNSTNPLPAWKSNTCVRANSPAA